MVCYRWVKLVNRCILTVNIYIWLSLTFPKPLILRPPDAYKCVICNHSLFRPQTHMFTLQLDIKWCSFIFIPFSLWCVVMNECSLVLMTNLPNPKLVWILCTIRSFFLFRTKYPPEPLKESTLYIVRKKNKKSMYRCISLIQYLMYGFYIQA